MMKDVTYVRTKAPGEPAAKAMLNFSSVVQMCVIGEAGLSDSLHGVDSAEDLPENTRTRRLRVRSGVLEGLTKSGSRMLVLLLSVGWGLVIDRDRLPWAMAAGRDAVVS